MPCPSFASLRASRLPRDTSSATISASQNFVIFAYHVGSIQLEYFRLDQTLTCIVESGSTDVFLEEAANALAVGPVLDERRELLEELCVKPPQHLGLPKDHLDLILREEALSGV